MCLCFKRKYEKKKKKKGDLNKYMYTAPIEGNKKKKKRKRRDRHFTWSSEPREGLLVCRERNVPSFLSYFKALSFGPASWIEPATFGSAVKRSTGWASPAACFICVLALVPLSFLSDWAIAVSCNFLHFQFLNSHMPERHGYRLAAWKPQVWRVSLRIWANQKRK